MRVWPGRPYPLGATWDGAGVNFALFSEHAHKGRTVSLRFGRRDRRKPPDRLARAHRPGLARLPARRAPEPALRLSRPRAVRAGEGPSLQSQQDRPRPLRQGDRPGRCAGTIRCSATRSATPRPTCRSTSATTPPSPRWPRWSIRPSPGATTGRRARPGTRRSSTSCTSRASPSGIPACPRSSAAPTPASGLRSRPSSTCTTWA